MKLIYRARFVCLASILLVGSPLLSAAALAASDSLPSIVANDNTRAAGVVSAGELTLNLRAAEGLWQPEGPAGPALRIQALGETSSSLTVPAPLIRVREGTRIVVSIRNDLVAPLRVHGLCTRDGSACMPLEVPPSQTREARFTIGRAGSYHYWVTTMGAPVPFRELAGALVVDPAEGVVEPDRVMVITEWTSLTPQQLGEIMGADDPTGTFLALRPRFAFVINGLSWPATERLTYRLGDTVRWRVINLSSQAHPMHLHGFYFDVSSLGNGLLDAPPDAQQPRRVVTQLIPSGGTMAMTWIPEREGNWLFHCHIMHHVSPTRRLVPDGRHAEPHHDQDRSAGMAGMILGVTVLGPAQIAPQHERADRLPRKLTLVMQNEAVNGAEPVSGFVLSEAEVAPAPGPVSAPGPAIVLRRGEPVEITLVNRLREATAVHWHGMELDSFYDGVHGWSGADQRLAPMIEAGGTFVVRFTPPHAGTFIYHTHLHDFRQLSSGLYGPLIVTDPGETFDPATDHVLVLGRTGVTSEEASITNDPSSVVLNGKHAPRFVWKAAARHRVRLINITPDDIFSVCLQSAEEPVAWKPLTKDGAAVPASASILRPACQKIAVGETYDFEYATPAGGKTMWVEIRSTGGKWQVQGQVIVK
ncbi:MAG: multicopper oxidase domain-containing protein [Gammaproteobacteria bacterium]